MLLRTMRKLGFPCTEFATNNAEFACYSILPNTNETACKDFVGEDIIARLMGRIDFVQKQSSQMED